MQYEFYVDVFFVENFMIDFLILLILKKMMGRSTSVRRICAGALFGSSLSALVMTSSLQMGVQKLLLHFGINVGMLIIGLKIRDKRTLVVYYVSLYIISFLFGGVFSFLHHTIGKIFQVGSLFMTITILSYFVVRSGIDVLERIWKQSEQYCEVTLYYRTHHCRVRALIDSGNHLADALTGKVVHIGSAELMEQLLEGETITHIRYLPYRTIQEEQGLLPVIQIDQMDIHGKEEKKIEEPLIGISKRASFENKEFELILHPEDC